MVEDSSKSLEQALAEVASLNSRLDQLERRSRNEANLPNSWLFSDSFLTRAFAIFGHNFVASLIISIPFCLLILMATIFISGAFRF
jgi:hypothetical protein